MSDYLIFKRIFDIISTIILLTFIFPFIIIIIILLFLLSGRPIFFKQKRLGKDGEIFEIIKFRTMSVENNNEKDVFVKGNDSRITRIGKVLRMLSLDELPQLFNVLKGDMSIIGPRPPLTFYPKEYSEYSEFEKKRFFIKPGLTGIAQINGRNALSWDEKFLFDRFYIEHMNVNFDIIILLRSIAFVMGKEGIFYSED